jgi:NitT/TauT family transport system substrate-binding protein
MALTPIRITCLRHSAFYSPLLYTIKSGLLEAEGLQPHYKPSTPDNPALAQVQSGAAHISQAAVAVSFSDLEKSAHKPDLVHFAQINSRDGFFLCRRGSQDVEFKLSDLENQEVLVDHLFQPLILLKYACHLHGVDYSKIRVIDAGGPDAMEKAFRQGQGTFLHAQGPVPQQLEHEGKASVVVSMGDAVGPISFSTLCAKRSWLETDMAKAFMRAYRKGKAVCAEQPTQVVAEVVQPFFQDTEPKVLFDTIACYKKMGTWDGDERISSETYERLLDAFLYGGMITRRHPYDAAIASVIE